MKQSFILSQKNRLLRRLEEYNKFYLKKDSPPHEKLKTQTSVPFIMMALERIEKGLYGICVDCEEDISEKRLISVPGAIRCVKCQALTDKKR